MCRVIRRLGSLKTLKILVIASPVLLVPVSLMVGTMRLSGTITRFLIHRDTLSSVHVTYDDTWLQAAHTRSAASGYEELYVGDQPLFEPCNTSLPPGQPAWGPYKYVGPFEYVKGSKNPCWHSAAGRLSCVPYFYLAGVSKSGTSDIFQRISHHPDVIVSHKEHHWFDRHRYYSRNLDDNSSFEWYLERFRNVTQAIQRDLLTSSFSKKITGDGSPSYFYDSLQWQRYPGNENCTEPRMLLPHHIRHLYHEARIILSFRHPVSRLYSRFLYDHRKDNSSETFHSWVVDGLAKYLQCFRRWSLRHCAYNRSLAQTVQLRINENLYPVLMEDWLRVFPRQQLLLIRFEDYCRNMSHVLSRIFTFLDLAPLNDTEMTKIASTEKIKNKGTGYKSAGLMLAKTAHILQEFYQPFIRRFARLVGDDSYLWTDVTISHQ
ncbi:carbohydrate sulfotransferase 15-like isoform X2 [Pomacea canaliculata]|uniref:carbohydrate sulfotransferase 15-like isoform X2 n=1 Tax=Pomacea canaliculata TaxID=400727 RepID=UPI000D7375E8|nr:carbohydrate sulfotransferase 15-like isoform X2 [Pomacea canaliculata]